MVTRHGELARFNATEQELFDVAPEVPALSAVETAVSFEAAVSSMESRGEGDEKRIEAMKRLIRDVNVLFHDEYVQFTLEQDLQLGPKQ